MNIDYFLKLLEWQQSGDHRSLDIKIGEPTGDAIKIWCYDYHLTCGKYVEEPEIPDLEAYNIERERAVYDKLHEKYGGA